MIESQVIRHFDKLIKKLTQKQILLLKRMKAVVINETDNEATYTPFGPEFRSIKILEKYNLIKKHSYLVDGNNYYELDPEKKYEGWQLTEKGLSLQLPEYYL